MRRLKFGDAFLLLVLYWYVAVVWWDLRQAVAVFLAAWVFNIADDWWFAKRKQHR